MTTTGDALLTRSGLTDSSLWLACGGAGVQHGARLSCGRSGMSALAFEQQACTAGALQQASTEGTKACAPNINEATVATTRAIWCGFCAPPRRGATTSSAWRRPRPGNNVSTAASKLPETPHQQEESAILSGGQTEVPRI